MISNKHWTVTSRTVLNTLPSVRGGGEWRQKNNKGRSSTGPFRFSRSPLQTDYSKPSCLAMYLIKSITRQE